MTEPYDFYNPFMTAKIVLDNGIVYPLWASSDQGLLNSLITKDAKYDGLGAPESLGYLQELSIELNLSQVPLIRATIKPPIHEALRLLDSNLVEFGKSRLSVQFGYVTSDANTAFISPVFEGLINPPDVRLGDNPSITINARGLAFTPDTSPGTATMKQPRDRWLRMLIEDRHPPLRLDFSGFIATTDASGREAMFSDELEATQGGKTDWQFATEIATDLGAFLAVGENNVVRVLRGIGTDSPLYTFAMFNVPNGGVYGPTTFPILDFQSPSSFVFFPGVREAILQDIDGLNRSRLVQTIGAGPNAPIDNSQLTPLPGSEASATPSVTSNYDAVSDDRTKPKKSIAGAAGVEDTPLYPAPAVTGGDFRNYATLPAVADDPGYVQKMKGLIENAQRLAGVQLIIDTLGVPNLSPGQTILVEGAGLRFNGAYGVFKVTHRIGNGYRTQIDARSNTSSFLDASLRQLSTGRTGATTAPPNASNNPNSRNRSPIPG